jgi:hypothetical protein
LKPRAGISGLDNVRLLSSSLLDKAAGSFEDVVELESLEGDAAEDFHDFRKAVRAVVRIGRYVELFRGADDATRAEGERLHELMDELDDAYGDLHDIILKLEGERHDLVEDLLDGEHGDLRESDEDFLKDIDEMMQDHKSLSPKELAKLTRIFEREADDEAGDILRLERRVSREWTQLILWQLDNEVVAEMNGYRDALRHQMPIRAW